LPRDIRRAGRLSRGAFQREFLTPGIPVLIEAPAPWPGNVWNVEAIANLGRDVEVAIEIGDVMQGETRLARDRLGAFVRRHLCDEAPIEPGPLPYLSVFDLLEPFPQLRRAMDFSLFAGAKHYERVRAWLGPAGTRTGFHYDIGDNLFYQLFGEKRVSLMPPSCAGAMYPSRKYDFMTVPSEVDDRDPARFPLFAAAQSERMDVTVGHGQMLFIPKFWWHQVQSLSGSISVNCFGWSRIELPRYGWEIVKYALHDVGLWGRRGAAHCVCHPEERPRGTSIRAKFLQRFPTELELADPAAGREAPVSAPQIE
jgi:hypothetical protein